MSARGRLTPGAGDDRRRRTTRRWLRCYPASWRARYGEELADLILATSSGEAIAWSTRLDVLRSGAGERLRRFGLGSGARATARVRAGALITLCGFAIFLVGAAVFQRFAENWQELKGQASVTAAGDAVLAMKVLAPLAALAVLCGILLVLPTALGVLVAERSTTARTPLRWALRLSVAAVASLALIAISAHGLSASQRNGHDTAYEIGFSAMAILGVACLAAWIICALSIASRIELSPRLARIETALATSVAMAMLMITAAVGVWWATLANTVPWVLHGVGFHGPTSPVTAPLLLAGALIALGAAIGACGCAIALHGAVSGSRARRGPGTPQTD
ncbi:MAG TPA: hypothetical protein VGF95_15230 [Solirubrobacteraceae bacterium]|jgi:hypothetical protein